MEQLEDPVVYEGDIEQVPGTISGLNKLSVAQLRNILRAHGVLEVGTKNEQILRIGLLKGGEIESAFAREKSAICHLIASAYEISKVLAETGKERVIRVRKYGRKHDPQTSTRDKCSRSIFNMKDEQDQVPNGSRSLSDILKVLEEKVNTNSEAKRKLEENSTQKPKRKKVKAKEKPSEIGRNRSSQRTVRTKIPQSPNQDRFDIHVGAIVEVFWSERDVKGTSLKPGWYRGEVQRYDEEDEDIYVLYHGEEGLYNLSLEDAFDEGIIRCVGL